jgi:hypothetical protein
MFDSGHVYTYPEIGELKEARCRWCRAPHRFVDQVVNARGDELEEFHRIQAKENP